MEVRRDEDFLRVLDYGGPKLDPFMATNTNRRISHRSRKEERRIKSRVSTETAGRPPTSRELFVEVKQLSRGVRTDRPRAEGNLVFPPSVN
jgi:hypothetical protein